MADSTDTPVPGSHTSSRPLRVLVVEDDADTLELHARLLEREGFEVLCASTAFEALTTARTEHVDVVVSDIGLPGVDGFALLRTLRKLRPELAEIPAIAITAHRADDDIDEAYRSGYQIHAAKPIDGQMLLHLVRAVSEQADEAETGESPA